MEDRRFRIGSVVEWLAAALCLAVVVWLLSVPAQRVLGPRVEAAPDSAPAALPVGVPARAISVPVMMLLDGRVVRVGELQTRVAQVLPDKLLTAPPLRSEGEAGERWTRSYQIDRTTVFVVSERAAGGPLRVTGIYLP